MAYIDYEYYKSLYGEKAIPEADFNRLSWEASRNLDRLTTGIDGIKKLKVAFPSDEDDSEAVRRCVVALIEAAAEIEAAEASARNAQGYVTREDGTIVNKVVSSVSAGNESISYATGSNASGTKTWLDDALVSKSAQEMVYKKIIDGYLSGVSDANGVNLLYMGQYPCRRLEKECRIVK